MSPGTRATIACILEATARKPGNVHRFADYDDAGYVDYLLSAAAIAGPLDRARADGVGRAVRSAIAATRAVVATNTNLGMVLLLAPLAAVPDGLELRDGVERVLSGLTVDDAREAYRAIRLANPGGMGTVAEHDVADEPTITLRAAMRLAADRDLVARQYANGYADVFDTVLPAMRQTLSRSGPLESAIIAGFLELLASGPDTLIARKRGPAIAAEASTRARAVLAAGSPDPSSPSYRELDAWLRADGHARNPGAAADLTAAALFVALSDGTIALPRPASPAGWQELGAFRV